MEGVVVESAAIERRRLADPMVVSGAIGVCVGLLIAAVFGLRALSAAQQAAAARPAVEVAVAAAAPLRAELVYTGTVQGAQQATVAPAVAGTIAALHVEVGATVRAGDRLASLDPGAIPVQLLQAQADLQTAQAKRALVLGGATATDIASAEAVLAAAQAKLDQLLNPSPVDIAVATAALSSAQTALTAAESNIENTRAVLLGAIANGCSSLLPIGLPCGSIEIPLAPSVTEAVASFLQSRAGDPRGDAGARAISVLQANAAYKTAIATAASARDAVRSAQAKLDAVRSPTAADLSAQRAQVEVARNALDRKLNAYTNADVLAANAAVAQARAQIAVAEANLARMTLLAPFDGVVVQRLLETGMNVTPQTPVFLLIGKAAEIHLTVRDEDASVLRAGAIAELTVPGDAAATLKGKVDRIAPAGDARSHTFDVKVLAEDPGGLLRPGILTQVRIVAAEKANALVVPSTAVFRLGTASHVLTVVDGKVRQRAVTVGISDRNSTEITGGLKPGDTVVVRGQQLLRDGQVIEARPSGQPQPSSTAGRS